MLDDRFDRVFLNQRIYRILKNERNIRSYFGFWDLINRRFSDFERELRC